MTRARQVVSALAAASLLAACAQDRASPAKTFETADPAAGATARVAADDKVAPTTATAAPEPPAPAQQPRAGEGKEARGGAEKSVGVAGPAPAPAAPPRRHERANQDGRLAMTRLAPAPEPRSRETYAHLEANRFTATAQDHLSTFGVDVDTASYTLVRRKLVEGQPVPPDAVRVEEFVNYFKYGYEGPGDGRPFAVHLEAAPSPVHEGRHLLRVGVQGRIVPADRRKPAHLVFLVDVSGSMSGPDRLPLARESLKILVRKLRPVDSVALVTYAGSTRLVLPATSAAETRTIIAAIDELRSGGSTAMASGLTLAYREAAKTLGPGAESRVIVLSDGDANVGAASHDEILRQIQGFVKEGVTLSTIGFGMGNFRADLMEQLADRGNGNAFYVDSLDEARKIFDEKVAGTLETIAQDVKIQVDFDERAVARYRLVGYENRDIADRDFRNDKVDSGDIGAGHQVTALYELELAAGAPAGAPLATVRLRAKAPRGRDATETTYVLPRAAARASFAEASADFRFAAAVAFAAEILRRSPYAHGLDLGRVVELARGAATPAQADRQELIALLGKAGAVLPQD
jgi:Ca-activated chloride channel family protein